MKEHMDKKEQNPGKKPGNRKERRIIMLLLLLLTVGVLLWYFLGSREEDGMNRDLSPGILPGSEEVDLADLGEEMIRLQINTRPVFVDGESEGNLCIGNPEPNQYDMEVIIRLEETGETVYNSGIIPPGYYIEYDRLDMVLEQGEHSARADVTYYTESGAVQSKSNAKQILTVEN